MPRFPDSLSHHVLTDTSFFGSRVSLKSGIVGNKLVWKVFSEDEGYLDGMCFDVKGCVWVAHWGAGWSAAELGVTLRFQGDGVDEVAVVTGTLEATNEPYAIAKIAGIKLCESYNRQYGRDYRSVMPPPACM